MRRVICALCALGGAAFLLVLTEHSASAWGPPCDFMTGGGFIIRDSGAKGTFSVGGGCKHGSPTWGHLEYHDHGTGLNTHWLTITGYFFVPDDLPPDPQTGQPRGTRVVCGTARTNQFGNVDFAVKGRDTGEPGVDDEFIIRLQTPGTADTVYTTELDSNHTLGGSGAGGGDIQLHKPNPSTTGSFGGTCDAFPEIEGP